MVSRTSPPHQSISPPVTDITPLITPACADSAAMKDRARTPNHSLISIGNFLLWGLFQPTNLFESSYVFGRPNHLRRKPANLGKPVRGGSAPARGWRLQWLPVFPPRRQSIFRAMRSRARHPPVRY